MVHVVQVLCLAQLTCGGEGGERIGFGLYQSCGNNGSVGCVSVFGLWWCRWGVGRALDQGLEWSYVCVSCESGFSV